MSLVHFSLFSGNRVISASSDGTVKVWDAKTTDCITTFRPNNQAGGSQAELGVVSVALMPKHAERIVVVNKSNTIYLVNFSGQVCVFVC